MFSPRVAAAVYATVSFLNVRAAIAGVPVNVTNDPIVTVDGSLTYARTSSTYGLASNPPQPRRLFTWERLRRLTVSNPALGDNSSTKVLIRYQAQ
jgi:hypothetical protein